MLSLISKFANPNKRSKKIHPESPRIETPRKDPCAQMYARYKEPGAYDQYSKMLSSNQI